MDTHDEEHEQANVENTIHSGKVQHSIECDLLFAEFPSTLRIVTVRGTTGTNLADVSARKRKEIK